ncbi:hypothetical protein EDC01DRAFT_608613 [Geopyxis carbonaria]|nr:hypothetical protein EDC01DRAFT_608613 [Geopyxis carbonaria]
MNVNALLADGIPAPNQPFHPPATTSTPHNSRAAMTPNSLSPNADVKAVSFRLRDSQNEPKTFHIRPHDTTDSIMDTVKHLLGLSRQYDLGVSLEDADELSFIPNYENFTDGMTVFVRIEESLPPDFARRHSYNLRQSQNGLNGTSSNSSSRTYDYPASRSISPVSRGRRSTSATTMHTVDRRSRHLKRSALDDHYHEIYHPDGQWSYLSQQPLMPDEYDEPRTKAGSVASADISVENILEGSRRKRPKFSSDELPLFPPPALPKQNGSVSSMSPSRPPVQMETPYTQRHFSFSHPTPPSNAGDYGYHRAHAGIQSAIGAGNSIVVPTPAPTVTSCISDEDVAIQLMRLGNANAGSGTTSMMGENRESAHGFVSDCGEYGDEGDGRSDTTELPDPLPPIGSARYGLPDSPILFPTGHRKFKSLDEILPSFDTTEPSDDENLPPIDSQISNGYAGMAKAIKRQPTLLAKPTSMVKPKAEPHYPISPASPPTSRKPSMASSIGNKYRPAPVNHHLATPGHENIIMQSGEHGVLEDHYQRPRCQRCRKSKKGCDRQRPCQRCKDAGIPADQCISEDEAGTRRGRQAAAAARRAGLSTVTKLKLKKKKKNMVAAAAAVA